MPEQDEQQETGDGLHEVGTSNFDHQNVKPMDRAYIVTMNNEHVTDGYTPSSEVALVKLQAEEMKLMELIDAGEVDVDTARAIMGGSFTLARAIDRSRDGFERRMKNTSIDVSLMTLPKKPAGFLSRLNPFQHREPETYPVEGRR